MKRNNKAQITTFIIIGVLLLLAVGLIIFFNSDSFKQRTQEIQELQGDRLAINKFMDSCIKTIAEDGIAYISSQGGFYTNFDPKFNSEIGNMSYSYFNGKSTAPSKEFIEDELKKFLTDAFGTCTLEEEVLNNKIFAENPIKSTEILPNEVKIEISYSFESLDNESVTNVNIQKINIKSNLGLIHSILLELVQKTLDDPDWIDLSYLSSFENLKIDILPVNESTLIYNLEDKESLRPYAFATAFTFKENSPPVINIADEIFLVDGVPRSFDFDISDPEGDRFTCSDNTALFDITPDCNTLFTPEVPGTYNVTITAIDVRNNRAEKHVLFRVT